MLEAVNTLCEKNISDWSTRNFFLKIDAKSQVNFIPEHFMVMVQMNEIMRGARCLKESIEFDKHCNLYIDLLDSNKEIDLN